MSTKLIITLLILGSVAIGCNSPQHANVTVPRSKLLITVNHKIDDKAIIWDSAMYTNQAGNVYSVENLQYYMSNFRFYRNGNFVFDQDSIFYIDAKKPTNVIAFNDIPKGGYDSIAFYIGVPEKYNTNNGLPATSENLAMVLNPSIGTGYHFLKLGGRWKDGALRPAYALNVGSSGYQAYSGFTCDLHLDQYLTNTTSISMNVNELFRTPFTYDLSVDPNQTLGNGGAMSKIRQNGADAFSSDK